MSISPKMAANRLALAQRRFQGEATKIARGAVTRISTRATNMPFMRDSRASAKSLLAGGKGTRRSPLDQGPLRIVTGRLKRSILSGGTGFRGEGIERATATGFKVKIEKGSKVPYAAVHENNPRFAYINPATAIERRSLARKAGLEVKNMVLTTLRGG